MHYTRRKKYCYFTAERMTEVDYKDVTLLKRFLSETFQIVPSRVTGTSPRFQRMLKRAVERARFLALIPYCDRH